MYRGMETRTAVGNWARTRRTLLALLRRTRTDEACWSEFFDAYSRLIFSVARKSGLSHGDSEDIVQTTVLKVSQYIDRFEFNPARGKFRNWVCMITKQQIANHYRKVNRQPLIDEWDPDDAGSMPEIEDPVNRWDEIWDGEYHGYLNGLALAKVKNSVSPKQYQIFHMYCIKGLAVGKIAEILGVSPNEVYLAKNRVLPIYEESLRRSQDEIGASQPA